MKKRLISIVMSILMTLITAVSCGKFELERGPIMTYGDFRYCYVTSADSNFRAHEADYIAILELTEEGRKKETIIIPEMIEDKTVILIGMQGMGWGFSLRESGGVYDKLYLSVHLQQIRRTNSEFAPCIKRFLLNMPNDLFFQNIGGVCYIPEPDYELYKLYFEENQTKSEFSVMRIANLTYVVNNEVYWIDDYEDGEYVTFPQTPQKEGYTFDGWYREPDYLTKWNEETDAYSKPEDVKTVKLYAKWIENK